jgi:hypothetical protein
MEQEFPPRFDGIRNWQQQCVTGEFPHHTHGCFRLRFGINFNYFHGMINSLKTLSDGSVLMKQGSLNQFEKRTAFSLYLRSFDLTFCSAALNFNFFGQNRGPFRHFIRKLCVRFRSASILSFSISVIF